MKHPHSVAFALPTCIFLHYLQVKIHTSETDEYFILFFSMISNNQKH